MLFDGFFQIFLGLGSIAYSFIGKMYGHFSKSKMQIIQKHGGLYFKLVGLLLIAYGVFDMIRSYQ